MAYTIEKGKKRKYAERECAAANISDSEIQIHSEDEEQEISPFATITEGPCHISTEISLIGPKGGNEDWDTDKYFDPSWELHIGTSNLANYFDIKWLQKNPSWKKWMEVMISADRTRFRCRISHQHFDKMGFSAQTKPGLPKAEGFELKMDPEKKEDSKRKNYELFKEHEQDKYRIKGFSVISGFIQKRTEIYIHFRILQKLNDGAQTKIGTSIETLQATIQKNLPISNI